MCYNFCKFFALFKYCKNVLLIHLMSNNKLGIYFTRFNKKYCLAKIIGLLLGENLGLFKKLS